MNYTPRTRTDFIAVHCSATKASANIDADEIRQWHTLPPPRGNGWLDIGYHVVIRRDGVVQTGRPLGVVGSHVSGYNSSSLGVCLVGGLADSGKAENNFTPQQYDSLLKTLHFLKAYAPGAKIQGHRDFPNVAKECPSFDVRAWLTAAAPELL